MVIYLGNKKPITVYKGTTEIGGVYLGTNPIYIPSEESDESDSDTGSDESDSDVGLDDTLIDSNTLGVFHFENNIDNAVIGSSLSLISTSSDATVWGFSNSDYKFGSYGSRFLVSNSILQIFGSSLDLQNINEVTIDFWVKSPTDSSYININVDGPIMPTAAAVVHNTYINTKDGYTANIESGSWHHIAIVYNQDRLITYIDGHYTGIATTIRMNKRVFSIYPSASDTTSVYFDELRVSNIVRYGHESFIPPNRPYHY